MKFFYSTFVILTILLLTSCGTINNLGEGAHLASYKADKRGSLIVVKDGQATMLSEVQPDAIISSVMKFTNKLDIKGKFTADQAVDITQAVTKLGERTEAVNILRDALYRLAEIQNSKCEIDSVTEKIFMKIVESAETIALADKESSAAENAKTQLKLFTKRKDYIERIGLDNYLKSLDDDN